MVKIAYSDENDLERVTEDRIIDVEDLSPFQSDKRWSGFPPLSKDIYNWCVKNKCPYRKGYYLPPSKDMKPGYGLDLERVLIFKNKENCKKFKDYWVDCVVKLEKNFYNYDFAGDHGCIFSDEVTKWLKNTKIKNPVINWRWIRFNSADDAMAFKLTWT